MAVVGGFFAAVEANYGGNPYHNSQHAADVSVGVHLFLTEHGLMETRFSDPVACLAVILAGVVHDFAHPGTTNPHEVKAATRRHAAFGDSGVLEKFHVRAAFALMRDPKLNILAQRRLRARAADDGQGHPGDRPGKAHGLRGAVERDGPARGLAVAF